MYEGRAHIERPFGRDELHVWLGLRTSAGLRVLEPTDLVFAPAVDDGVAVTGEQRPSLVLSMELAEALLRALAAQLRGVEVADALGTLQEAHQARRIAEERLDKLITGISRGVAIVDPSARGG